MEENEWSPPHAHEPNPEAPSADASIVLHLEGREVRLTPEMLHALPQITVPNCRIVSTGHGISGPFTFGGIALWEIVNSYSGSPWTTVDIISADGFRTRVTAAELVPATPRPILLALSLDGRPLSRAEGLVRLIVPGEVDDALRQVKWISEIRIRQ